MGKGVRLTCEKTGKLIYPTKGDAIKEIKRIKSLHQKNKKPQRAYECEHCSGWHLTSMEKEYYNQVKEQEPPQADEDILTSMNAVEAALLVAHQYGLQNEVVTFALDYMKKDNTLTISQAIQMGVEEWVK